MSKKETGLFSIYTLQASWIHGFPIASLYFSSIGQIGLANSINIFLIRYCLLPVKRPERCRVFERLYLYVDL